MNKRNAPHASITLTRVMEAINEDEYPGLCIRCGADTSGVEPDAERYPCDECGAEAVYGAEQLILCGLYHSQTPPDDANRAATRTRRHKQHPRPDSERIHKRRRRRGPGPVQRSDARRHADPHESRPTHSPPEKR